MGKKEGTIEDYLINQGKKLGFKCYKFVSPANNGVPDRLVCGHGSTIFVECKAPGETLRRLQQETIKEMEFYGAEIYVVDQKPQIDELFSWLINREKKINTPSRFEKLRYIHFC